MKDINISFNISDVAMPLTVNELKYIESMLLDAMKHGHKIPEPLWRKIHDAIN